MEALEDALRLAQASAEHEAAEGAAHAEASVQGRAEAEARWAAAETRLEAEGARAARAAEAKWASDEERRAWAERLEVAAAAQAAAREHERAHRDAAQHHAAAAQSAEAAAADAEARLRVELEHSRRGGALLEAARLEGDALATECDALRHHVAELEYQLETALVDARRHAARSPPQRHPPAEAISEVISAPRQMARQPQPTPRGQPPVTYLQPRSPPLSKRGGTQLARHQHGHQSFDGDLMDRIVVMRHWDYFNQHIRE